MKSASGRKMSMSFLLHTNSNTKQLNKIILSFTTKIYLLLLKSMNYFFSTII